MEEKSGGKRGKELQKFQNWYATGVQISFISKMKTTSAIRPKCTSLLPVNSCTPVLAVRSPVPWYETNTKLSLCNTNMDDVLVLGFFAMFWRLFHFKKLPGAFKVLFVCFLSADEHESGRDL